MQTFSDIILAYYDSDFERITQKNYKYDSSPGRKIIFMIDGQIMSDDFTLSDLDYTNFRKTAI